MSGEPFAPFAPVAGRPRLPAWWHVMAMCDGIGMFEHADLAEPRLGEGTAPTTLPGC